MLLDCLFIIVGVVLVLWGADRLTEGAAPGGGTDLKRLKTERRDGYGAKQSAAAA